MKVPLCEVQQLLSVRKPRHPPPAKFDIGVNVDCPFIPVFRMTPGYAGRIYPMFLSEYGSICMTLDLEDGHDVELELKCYPRVVHAVKAAGVTMNIPCTNKGMKSKLELIKNYIDEILSNSISITGFRYEICCKGNLSLQ